jgi:uncharacterized phage protein (TIGR02218 family)
MSVDAALQAHLDSGTTTLCRCWKLVRSDGRTFGFTDHDTNIEFDGTVFRANSGLSAEALAQSTGLSVDNTEAVGALSDVSVTEQDILTGRFDSAAVEAWLVNWADPTQRSLRFRGTLGELQSGGGAFRAELRGIADLLNRPRNRVYQSLCAAGLGDAACGVDLEDPALKVEVNVSAIRGTESFDVTGLGSFAPGWFERGRCLVLTGDAEGLGARIKVDQRSVGGIGHLTLWEDLRTALKVGDRVRLQAGCDKRLVTCRDRFANSVNFRGFPHLPGEDWMVAYPAKGGRLDGGRRT